MPPLFPLPEPPNIKVLPWYAKDRSLPPYRFVPGLYPHPIRDPRGHSHRAVRLQIHPPWTPGQWKTLEAYLRGIDLFNRFYFWEAHEGWEPLWKSHPPQSDPAYFIQGLINLAAAFLKFHMQEIGSAQKLLEATVSRLHQFRGTRWMGIDITQLLDEISRFSLPEKETPLPKLGADTPSIRLVDSSGSEPQSFGLNSTSD